MSRLILLLACALAGVGASSAAQLNENFPGRQPYVVNSCPFVELSGFTFGNRFIERGTRFEMNMSWRNIGQQPLVAFEIVVLKYDAFNRRLIGTRWTVAGNNSADWSALAPGATGADGTRAFSIEEVFTAIAYVRSARLADGTVWSVDRAKLLSQIQKAVGGFHDFGDLDPDPRPKPPNQ